MTNRQSPLSRRAFLKGLGGAAMTLPLLQGLPFMQGLPSWLLPVGTAAAAPGGDPPLRLVIMWHPNGTVPENWGATGSETDFTFRRILEPLEAIKQDVVVLDGLDALSAYSGPGDAHQRATGQCLTGTELQEGSFQGAEGRSAGWANATSVDQVIARQVGRHTRFPSLELGVFNAVNNINGRINFAGPAQPLPPENDPRAVFQRLFGDPTQPSAERDALAARRRSVLDAVTQRYRTVMPRLGAEDRQKIDAHLTAVREIEQRLESTGPVCEPPGAPAAVSLGNYDNIPQVGRLQMDLLVSALRCDLTRVTTLMWMNSATDKLYPWLDVRTGHHVLSHAGSDNAYAREALTRIYRWYAEQFVYLVKALESVPEGNGTMLDNTLVVWLTEHSEGNVHERHGVPYVLAGGAQGRVRTGRYLRLAGDVPHNNLWVSVQNMFGIESQTFGNPRFCTGPLSGLT